MLSTSRLVQSSLSSRSILTSDSVGSDDSVTPRVNRRRPFDLHWRRDPPEWRGRIASAYQHNRQPGGSDAAEPLVHSSDDGIVAYWWCPRCGSVTCPLDPRQLVGDGEKPSMEGRQGSNAELVLRLAAEKTELSQQLEEVQKLLETALRLQRENNSDREQIQKRLTEREHICKLMENERSALVKEIARLRLNNPTNENLTVQNKQDSDERGDGAKLTDRSGNPVDELAMMQEALDALKAEIAQLRDDKESVERLLSERDAKLTTAENRLAASNDELTSMKAVMEGGAANRGRSSMTSLRGGLAQIDEDELPLLPYTNHIPDVNGKNVFLIGGSGVAGRIDELSADRQLLNKTIDELNDEKYRRSEAEREADMLRRLVNETMAELDAIRADHDRMADDLAAAVRAKEVAGLRRDVEFNVGDEQSRVTAVSRRITVADERSFQRFVALTRQLNEARDLNEKLREELHAAPAKKSDSAPGRRSTVFKVLNNVDPLQRAVVEETTFVIDTSGCTTGLLKAVVRPDVKLEADSRGSNRDSSKANHHGSNSKRWTVHSFSGKDAVR